MASTPTAKTTDPSEPRDNELRDTRAQSVAKVARPIDPPSPSGAHVGELVASVSPLPAGSNSSGSRGERESHRVEDAVTHNGPQPEEECDRENVPRYIKIKTGSVRFRCIACGESYPMELMKEHIKVHQDSYRSPTSRSGGKEK